MDRVRRAGQFALFLAAVLAAPATGWAPAPSGGPPGRLAAAVSWPVSTLLVSEVMTGGASASDEFAEITNAGSIAVDLTGFELVYVTSSGGTVTRKAAWTTATILEPGRHLLVANATGSHAATADATYSGGFAAAGGAVAIRPIGGVAVDAVGWGDAASSFVEGQVAPAPAIGSSIERLPGGPLGNGLDSNDNATDFAVQGVPSPQNLAAPPAPDPSSTPGPTPPPSPSASPTMPPTPAPPPSPLPTPTGTPTLPPSPLPTPTGTPTLPPSPVPDPIGTPTLPPSPLPTPTGTPILPPSPVPDPITTIADARAMAEGTVVTLRGTLTTPLGAIESARIGFLQDAGAGIAIRLDTALVAPLPRGTAVQVTGSIASYFSLRVVNADPVTLVDLGSAAVADPLDVDTGSATEPLEGTRLTVTGIVTATPSDLADGLGVTIDDGTGPLRLVVGPDALQGVSVGTGNVVTAVGPLGQRDSGGTGTAGYRLHATTNGEFSTAPAPTPTPGPSATPTPSAAPSGSPSASPSPSPVPTGSAPPSPTPGSSSIGDARGRAVGSIVVVTGVVTAEAGRLGSPPLIAIQDATGGIVVRVPDGVARPPRGSSVEVRGPLADPYGQLEVRPTTADLRIVGSGSLPDPASADAASIGESLEGRLIRVNGSVDGRPTKATSGDVTFFVSTPAGDVRIVADASSGIAVESVTVGASYEIVGVAGQRASRKGLLDGYRVWPRGTTDLRLIAGPSPAPTATPGPDASPTASPTAGGPTGVLSIADAVRRTEGMVTVEGLVTTGPALLDSTGRRLVIEDRTAGVEILVPADGQPPTVGSRIRVEGTIGRAYDAPRIKAVQIAIIAVGARPLALDLDRAPTAAHEWRLVRVSGTVIEVRKLGDRWRADVAVGPDRVAVTGLTGAGIPSTALAEGRAVTIVGIVRRPYPGASDRRWSIAPRSPADVAAGSAASSTGDPGRTDPSAGPGAFASAGRTATGVPTVDLIDLADHVGSVVRVGGLVSELVAGGFHLDDGTAIGFVVLEGTAGEYLPLLEPGDALNATGRVHLEETAYRVVVDDPAGLVRVGDPTVAVDDVRPPTDDPLGSMSAASHQPIGRVAGGLLGEVPAGAAGVVGVGLISLASLCVTLLRRQRARRLLAARVASRLASLTAPHGPA